MFDMIFLKTVVYKFSNQTGGQVLQSVGLAVKEGVGALRVGLHPQVSWGRRIQNDSVTQTVLFSSHLFAN